MVNKGTIREVRAEIFSKKLPFLKSIPRLAWDFIIHNDSAIKEGINLIAIDKIIANSLAGNRKYLRGRKISSIANVSSTVEVVKVKMVEQRITIRSLLET